MQEPTLLIVVSIYVLFSNFRVYSRVTAITNNCVFTVKPMTESKCFAVWCVCLYIDIYSYYKDKRRIDHTIGPCFSCHMERWMCLDRFGDSTESDFTITGVERLSK